MEGVKGYEAITTYTDDNRMATIDNGRFRNEFTYGPSGMRFKVDHFENSTKTKTKIYVDNSEYALDASANVVSAITIVYAPTGACAVYEDIGGVKTFSYIHTDYLGSWLAITGSTGSLKKRYSYDAWGRPRNPLTWVNLSVNANDATGSLNAMQPMFDRGYTGHEHMACFGLINMNGRLYDPYVQRFLSPDPFVQAPGNAQNYNRYSYVLNNPLMYTDPSGYEIIVTDDAVTFTGSDIAAALQQILSNWSGFRKSINYLCSLNEKGYLHGGGSGGSSAGLRIEMWHYPQGQPNIPHIVSRKSWNFQINNSHDYFFAIMMNGVRLYTVNSKGEKEDDDQAWHDDPSYEAATPSLDDLKKGPPNHPDYKSPKGGDKKVRNPNGKGTGWLDRNGRVWVPDDHKGTHAPHWDRQEPRGGYTPIYPYIQPVFDQSMRDRIGELVGLTGTALTIYLIISEGSRFFPPRNLIPVP